MHLLTLTENQLLKHDLNRQEPVAILFHISRRDRVNECKFHLCNRCVPSTRSVQIVHRKCVL